MKSITLLIVCLSAILYNQDNNKITIFLVGDSTVQNGSGKGSHGLWGWGAFLADQMDTSRVEVINKARGGRSSRTFISEGLWNLIHDQIKKGDYVIIQFGHNGGPVNDNFRARGSIKGNGEETLEINNMLNGKRELVKSYGWYIRKYIADTKAKGGIPIVCSLVARNRWEGDKVIRARDTYTAWAKEAAMMEGAHFIDLNDLVATKYESLGERQVTKNLFLTDHTHTNYDGAVINAKLVAQAIKDLRGCDLSEMVK